MTDLGREASQDNSSSLHGPYPQFILFGDSITQWSCKQDLGFNFMPALQDDFVRRLDVINRGFSGYNTAQAKVVLPKFMPSPDQARIEYMVVFFGANDACLPESPSRQHVPLESYANNLEEILKHPTVSAHQPRLILITPPPVNEYQLNFPDAIRTAEVTQSYAIRCRKLGEKLGVPVLDLWSTMAAKAEWKEGQSLLGSKSSPKSEALEKMLSDGLHFLPPAYKVLYDSLMQLINDIWPDDTAEASGFRFPVWSEAPW